MREDSKAHDVDNFLQASLEEKYGGQWEVKRVHPKIDSGMEPEIASLEKG